MGNEMNQKLPMLEYLRSHGLSSSALVMADESMAKFHAYTQGQIKYESKSLSLGTEVHAALEDIEAYLRSRVEKPAGVDYRTKEGKEFKASIQPWQVLIDSETMDTVIGCCDSYQYSEDALISLVRDANGENEVSHFWEEHGLEMKARADRIVSIEGDGNEYLAEHWPSLFNPISNKIVIDFKTTSRKADPRSWSYQMKDWHYAIKASHYLEGFKADAFLWIVLETSAPYHITRYLMSPATAAFYSERRKSLINQISECSESGVWPGLSITDEETLI